MPRNAALVPAQELPPFEALIAVATRLTPYAAKEAIAKSAAAECIHAQETWKKELKHIYEQQTNQENAPVTNLAAMERDLKGRSKILENMLTFDGRGADVDALHKQHTGALPIAEGLIALAKDEGGKAILAYAENVGASAHKLAQAQKRVADGGHALFDDGITETARKIWVALDNSYDILGVCLRKAGIPYDSVFASRPTTKTSLRPQLSLVPLGVAAGPKKKKAKKITKPAATVTPISADPHKPVTPIAPNGNPG